MQFNDLIKERYSLREYSDKEIKKEDIIQILKAGQYAPSAANKQAWHFIVIHNIENRKLFSQVYHREWFKDAKAYIVVCGNKELSWHRPQDNKSHMDIDTAIATDHMTLQAADIGIGTCWICNFDINKCTELLNIPTEFEPIAILSLGYATERKTPNKKRKQLDKISSWEKFQL